MTNDEYLSFALNLTIRHSSFVVSETFVIRHFRDISETMIAISSHREGCLLSVRAQPGARKNAVVGEHGGSLKVAVAAPPEDGRANAAITELLRDWLGLKRSQVKLAQGATNRNKQFLIIGVDAGQLSQIIENLLV
jgi:uncharacterized protein (TIGR00251 family)